MAAVKKKENCYGCSACQQICPKQCIEMTEDTEGFLYPSINKEQCVDCGLCEKVCPIIQIGNTNRDNEFVTAYIAYQRDEAIRRDSSSGGIFSVLADWVIDRGGVVFGAAFDENYMVHHISVTNKRELCLLRGSKYTQSRIENTYREVRHYLEIGRIVLFSGTGCQIAGLRNYLRKEYSNLILIDVLCHGVPTPKLWKLYLSEQEKSYASAITTVDFRSKDTGWKNYSVQLGFANHQVYQQEHSHDAYFRLFLSNICLRPSCYNCRFKEFPRGSDITLGDCWGVEKHSPEMDDDMGTSVVIVNSEKGKVIREKIANSCIWKTLELNKILPINADSRKSVTAHWNRPKFLGYLNGAGSFSELLSTIEPSFIEKVKHKLNSVKSKILS